jgi:glyoxylase I family protein
MELNSIHHIAIISSNYDVSKNFYVNILGFEIIRENYRNDRNSYKLDLKIGNSEIELFSMNEYAKRLTRPEACGLRHLAFSVNNIESVIAELNSKGIVTEPIRIDEYTGKKFTFFNDPDGLPLELHE